VKRVLVIGAGGAGKTTVATRLARHTGLPLIHLDALYWRPGWEPTPADEWRATVETLVKADSWIMDGNYGGTLDLRLQACDTVVFLDRSRLVCLWHVFVRQLRHLGRRRSEVPAGCRERLTWQFVTWIWTYPARRRGAILARLAVLGEPKRVVIVRSRRAAETFLRSVEAAA
jgi:adenylate kinase family enzyme